MLKVRFSEAALIRLKPRKVKYDLHDSEGTGLILRISPQGRKTWMVDYRSPTGIKQQRAIGKFPAMRLAEARPAALRALSGVQDERTLASCEPA